MATCSEDENSAVAHLSAMFPDLEWEVIQTVLENHGGCVEPSVHYLVAVLGSTEDLPLSEDIGGLPQVILDDDQPTSDIESCIIIDIDDDDRNSSTVVDDQSDTSVEILPTYHDIKDSSPPPPPPSYDSLHSASHLAEQHVTSETSSRMSSLSQKVCNRRRKKKGYQSYGT